MKVRTIKEIEGTERDVNFIEGRSLRVLLKKDNLGFKIQKDVTYILDNYDNHTFKALTDVVLISVFNPPCTGNEVHKNDGSYELLQTNKNN